MPLIAVAVPVIAAMTMMAAATVVSAVAPVVAMAAVAAVIGERVTENPGGGNPGDGQGRIDRLDGSSVVVVGR